MATRIQSKREHSIGLEAARAAALNIAKRAEEKASITYRVNGDRIDVEGKGVKGHMTVDATHVEIDLELGMLLRPMKSVIERKIGDYFERYFSA